MGSSMKQAPDTTKKVRKAALRMNLRPYIIGALFSLVVAIIAGTVVFYVTREKPEIPIEELIYCIDRPAAITTDTTKLTIQTIQVANVGTQPAQDVTVSIRFEDGIIVRETKIDFSTGTAAHYSMRNSGDVGVDIDVPSLLPRERLKATFLLEGVTDEDPEVSVKSAETIGGERSLLADIHSANHQAEAGAIFEMLLPILIVMQIIVVVLLLTRFRRSLSAEVSAQRWPDSEDSLFNSASFREILEILQKMPGNQQKDVIRILLEMLKLKEK